MFVKKCLLSILLMWAMLPQYVSASCGKFQNSTGQKILKNDPGYYYFGSSLCNVNRINSVRKFRAVVRAMNIAAAHNYPLAFFTLGLLYENKFKNGSTWLGSKGTLDDLNKAIGNYKRAANNHSVEAEGNLGLIYLHYANLTKKYRIVNDSDSIEGVSTVIPDLELAIYWLEKAAMHGSPSAQGTLSDLYFRGVGVPQDFVKAYVWQNLSNASQYRYNKNLQGNESGRAILESFQELATKQYKQLTEEQKNSAQSLINHYSKYLRAPSKLDRACQMIQSYISGILLGVMMEKLPK